MISSADVRRKFLDFFAQNGHQEVSSSPLVPANDKTLLFTNAGMVQFKDVFLGDDKRSYNRAVTSQRCVRAGGKHNDLENVGYTARHHTFFEMLGNFSFGDYFKADAIQMAWKLLTEVYGLPKDKLLVTVYHTDKEAADIWLNTVGIPEDKLIYIDTKDNFWEMGDTGPCGPCTEIFYDHGEHIWGGPPGSAEEDGDRFIEIWNLVFMQYERDASGELNPLPAPSVDTGMGLERLAAILQNVHSNYEIDLFQNLIAAAAKATGHEDLADNSLKVIADHIRSTAFLIVDGILPSNEGRGYVLRRIIRRAVRHGYKLGQTKPFFYQLVAALAKEMGDAYPELVKSQANVERIIRTEEERFAETIGNGMSLLEGEIAKLSGKIIPGEVIFKLYDTYGFPVDLTGDIARERELELDVEGYEKAMEGQRQVAKAASKFGVDYRAGIRSKQTTDFQGYDLEQSESTISEIYKDSADVSRIEKGDEAVIVLEQTPFYAESGGQVGDTGTITTDTGTFAVQDTQKTQAAILHIGVVTEGYIEATSAKAGIDHERRQAIKLNHSATHLMHAALRTVLGDHVEQKGSLVTEARLRFDFSHFEAVTAAELEQVEDLVNAEIRANHSVVTELMSLDSAIEAGAMALFDEKYDDDVRTLKMGDFSFELCGGTHAQRTGDIGVFRILSESGVSAGVRRIEAVSGRAAITAIRAQSELLLSAAGAIKTSPDNLADRVKQLAEQTKKQQLEIQGLKQKLASGGGQADNQPAVEIKGIKVITRFIDGVDNATLRQLTDQYKAESGKAVIALATIEDDTVRLVAGVTDAETAQIKAGDVVKHIAGITGARGGGRADFAQAGGGDPAKVEEALASVADFVDSKLS
jgi:alanyl-tRNA synthetase